MNTDTAEPYLLDPPEVEIRSGEGPAVSVQVAGRPVKMRRLGMGDWFHLLKLCGKVQKRGTVEARHWLRQIGYYSGAEDANPGWGERLLGILVFGMEHAKDEVLSWMADLLTDESGAPWPVADLADPKKFPLGSEVRLVRAFVEHPDFADFFSQSQELLTNPRFLAARERLFPPKPAETPS